MTQEQIITLAQIYNILMTIETKGNNTIIMANCLEALKQLIMQIQGEKGEKINGE